MFSSLSASLVLEAPISSSRNRTFIEQVWVAVLGGGGGRVVDGWWWVVVTDHDMPRVERAALAPGLCRAQAAPLRATPAACVAHRSQVLEQRWGL